MKLSKRNAFRQRLDYEIITIFLLLSLACVLGVIVSQIYTRWELM